jgi:hypothetical protein
VREQCRLPDEGVLQRTLVALYLRDVAPDAARAALQSTDVLPRIGQLAASESALTKEVVTAPDIKENLEQFVRKDVVVQVVVRRRRFFIGLGMSAALLMSALAVLSRSSTDPAAARVWIGFLGFAALASFITMAVIVGTTRVSTDGNTYNCFSPQLVEHLMVEAPTIVKEQVRRVVNRHLDAEFEPVLTAAAAPGLGT